jgi:hypothetical protein
MDTRMDTSVLIALIAAGASVVTAVVSAVLAWKSSTAVRRLESRASVEDRKLNALRDARRAIREALQSSDGAAEVTYQSSVAGEKALDDVWVYLRPESSRPLRDLARRISASVGMIQVGASPDAIHAAGVAVSSDDLSREMIRFSDRLAVALDEALEDVVRVMEK